MSRQTLSSYFGVRKDVGWLGKYWPDANATRGTRGRAGALCFYGAKLSGLMLGQMGSEFLLSRLTMPSNVSQVFF